MKQSSLLPYLKGLTSDRNNIITSLKVIKMKRAMREDTHIICHSLTAFHLSFYLLDYSFYMIV